MAKVMQNKDQVKRIELLRIGEGKGNLTFLEENNQVPFKIERVMWNYDIPVEHQVEGYAHKRQKEIIIALSGSFDVVITEPDGLESTFELDCPHKALYIPPKTFRHTQNHSQNAISLHLMSNKYNEKDYIRNFDNL